MQADRRFQGSGARPECAAPVLVALGLLCLVATLLLSVEGQARLLGLDELAGSRLRARLPDGWQPWVERFSNAHRPRGILLLSGAASLIMWWRRDPVAALCLPAAVVSGSVLNDGLKRWIARPRPGDLPGAPSDFSFPSGHVVSAEIFYGMLAAWWLTRLHSRWARAALVLGAACAIALVGLSRLLLRAHHPSDVLGGLVVGLAWLVLWVAMVRRLGA